MEFIEVAGIEKFPYRGKVYDLEVEVDHCYTANNYSVHNSAAGGLVNYLIGLTYVDPLKYGLLFERFLDPSREDLPDIDQDIEPRIRDDVIQHMVDTYGSESVCNIGTYGILKTRSAILDACRVCGIDPQKVFAITTELPTDLSEKKSLSELEDEYPKLKEFLNEYDSPETPLRFYISSIKGAQKSIGTHAAGVLISKNILSENIPLIKSKKAIVTGWIDGEDGRELSGLNYAKMDVLGLKNLEVIHDAVDLIKERKGVEIDVDAIDLDDPEVYKHTVNANNNYGIFQFESSLSEQLIEKIHPDNMMELSDISSMMRPGPLAMGIHDMYADRKFCRAGPDGKIWTEDDIPEKIKPIMKGTYGLLCLSGDSKILTEEGPFLISDIVNQHLKIKVLTYNEKTNILEWKPIKNWMNNGIKEIIELDFGEIKLKCTADHKIFTKNRGWVEAQFLTEDDDIYNFDGFFNMS